MNPETLPTSLRYLLVNCALVARISPDVMAWKPLLDDDYMKRLSGTNVEHIEITLQIYFPSS
jgi:hypothetical protein